VRDGNSRCPRHRQQLQREIDARRGSATERGYSGKWRAARAAYLRAHPRCSECERNGCLTAASVVDHIVAHKGDPVRFWDYANWQPLCKRCHDRKTATADGRWG
jgi:5-methylcytosine-specific restriction protein A